MDLFPTPTILLLVESGHVESIGDTYTATTVRPGSELRSVKIVRSTSMSCG